MDIYGWIMIFLKMADDGIVFPYSVELIKDINYQNNVSANNPVYTEKSDCNLP